MCLRKLPTQGKSQKSAKVGVPQPMRLKIAWRAAKRKPHGGCLHGICRAQVHGRHLGDDCQVGSHLDRGAPAQEVVGQTREERSLMCGIGWYGNTLESQR